MLNGVAFQSGEGRFRWLHAAPGAINSIVEAATEEIGHLGYVVTKDRMLDEHWFGQSMAPAIRSRLGDVALVAREPISFYDPADSGPFELVCRHGALTSAEVNVPLLATVV